MGLQERRLRGGLGDHQRRLIADRGSGESGAGRMWVAAWVDSVEACCPAPRTAWWNSTTARAGKNRGATVAAPAAGVCSDRGEAGGGRLPGLGGVRIVAGSSTQRRHLRLGTPSTETKACKT